MGIDGIQGKRDKVEIEQQYGKQSKTVDSSKAGPIDRDDHVRISSETQDFLRIRNLVDATPDIRQERVDQLRRQIAEGTYDVPGEDIADAILDTWA